ncbi:MAG TPA: hypothetical protein VFM29_02060 [Vicinamibacteria bacterium]|nr:hypothetical protein [Vicinamibacteria bacterium]
MTAPSLAAVWRRFWFGGGSAIDLGAARIVIAGHALWLLSCRDFAAISGAPAPFWRGAAAATRYAIVPGHPGAEAFLQSVALVSLVAALVGVAARPACLVAGLLLYHLAPYEVVIWTASPYARGFTVTVLALFLLGLGPSDHALAVRAPKPASADAGDYAWPLRAVQVLLCQIYFFSFLSKLYVDGLAWARPDNIRKYLLVFNQDDEVAVFSAIGLFLADRPALCLALGAATLALEAAFPLVLVSRRARWILLPAALLFHAGVLVAMNVFFFNVPQLLVLVRWEELISRMRLRIRGPRWRGRTAATP